MDDLIIRLDALTVPGELVERLVEGEVRCLACAHRCRIKPGKRGVCQVRFNREGELRVPWGYVSSLNVDPIEKKPFNHLLPGGKVLTFGMLGCDFHCDFCQNWEISQVMRDPNTDFAMRHIQTITPGQLVRTALQAGASMIASSYNEPLITSEWAVGIFKQAQQAGLRCAYVSNGNATPEALAFLRPYLTAYKVDLKTMQEKQYQACGGQLKHVLATIRQAYEIGLWVEVVTLVIPGFNDSPEELWQAASFIASVSPDIPWHVTAFHPDYQRLDTPPTHAQALALAADIGQEAGLRYVYAGNLPGRVGSLEDTHCPKCGQTVIKRVGYRITENRLTPEGTCPTCRAKVPGVWA